jgi:ribosomal protein L20
MPRVKRGTKRRAKRKKILERASGYFLTKSKLYRSAKEAVDRALKFAYSGRKQKKRQYRSIWIVRIGAAARLNGLNYNQFIRPAWSSTERSWPIWRLRMQQDLRIWQSRRRRRTQRQRRRGQSWLVGPLSQIPEHKLPGRKPSVQNTCHPERSEGSAFFAALRDYRSLAPLGMTIS